MTNLEKMSALIEDDLEVRAELSRRCAGLEGTDGGFDAPSTFSSTLKTTTQLKVSPALIGATGLLTSAFLLLVTFPAELLESTIRENYGRAFGWTVPIKRRLASIRARLTAIPVNNWVASLGLIAVTALILGFSDPGFGFTGSSAGVHSSPDSRCSPWASGRCSGSCRRKSGQQPDQGGSRRSGRDHHDERHSQG